MEEIKQLQHQIDLLHKRIDQLEKIEKTDKSPIKLTDLKDLFTALAKAQSEMDVAEKKSSNPFLKSKYADFAEVVRVSRPALTKYQLAIIQDIFTHDNGENILHTILTHSSGQWIESRMRIIPPKGDVQSLASYITYLKRYAYASLVGVVAKDEDDDGDKAVSETRTENIRGTSLNKQAIAQEKGADTVTREQLDELLMELDGQESLTEEILSALDIQTLADVPKNLWSNVLKKIREIKHQESTVRK